MSKAGKINAKSKDALFDLESFIHNETLEYLFAAIPQQFWIADSSGSLIYASPRSVEYFGFGVELILGYQWEAFVHQDDLLDVRARLGTSFRTGKDCHVEFRLKDAQENFRWHILRASPIRNARGKALLWVMTHSDISARKEIESNLALSQVSLSVAQTHAKIGSWRRDLKTSASEWSKELFEIFGFPPGEKPPSFSDIAARIHPDDLDRVRYYYETQFLNGQSHKLEFRLIHTDGKTKWIEALSETLLDADKNPFMLVGTSQDVTTRKLTELKLSASESRFSAFIENSPCIAFIKDAQGKFVYVNSTYQNRFKILSSEMLGKTVFDLWPKEIAQQLNDYDAQIFNSEIAHEAIEKVPTPEGEHYWHSVKFIFKNDQGEKFLGCTAFDVSDRQKSEENYRHQKKLLETSQTIAKLGGWEFDLQTHEVLWNDEIYRILDTSREKHTPTFDNGMHRFVEESRVRLAAAIEQAIAQGKPFDLELEIFTDKQRRIHIRLTGSATIEDGITTKLTGILQDISAQKVAQLALETANSDLAYANKVLENIAHYDPLTHLPNRVLLSDRMQQAMIHNLRNQTTLAVAFLDLDGFKSINDQFGHSVGDKFLITLAHSMKEAMREGDTLARIGGDEFVVVLSDLKVDEYYEPLLTRLLNAASQPFLVDQISLSVTASIGVTLYPQDNVDAEQLLRHADQAMYLAKQAGKNCFHLFDTVRDTAVKTQRETLEQIRKALHNNEFILYYQPKVNMRTGELIGAEALIRWQHPERGLVPPALFLPVIENHIYSIEMGEWVIARALRQMIEWQEKGLSIPVSVNIGALQLQQPNFPQRLEFLLAQQAHINPNQLELEILETSALEDITQVSTTIKACKELGVTFALDDFGTGYASLAYLKRLPAELLKIDQTFVRDMLEDPDDLAIIQGIIGLAKAFNRQVIAEGVETSAHGKKLLALGCDLGQGYGIARPMPAENIPNWLDQWRSDPSWTQ